MGTRRSLDISFGIEIEFIIAYNPSALNHDLPFFQHSTRLRNRHYIIGNVVWLLREAGFSVNDPDTPDNFKNWTVASDGSIEARPDDIHDRRWHQMYFHGMELKTPVFNHRNRDAAFHEVERVLDCIQSRFNIFTNKSCGLHVHVGNGKLGFSLPLLKNFAMLVLAFEKQLASIHPAHRIDNIQCKGPSQLLRSIRTVEGRIDIVEEVASVKELVNIMCPCSKGDRRHCAYNLTNLIREDRMQTIEFRQHEGTLNVCGMAMWTAVVCGLVEFSSDMSCLGSNLCVYFKQ